MFNKFVMAICTSVAMLSFIAIFIFCFFGLEANVITPVVIIGGISCIIAMLVDKYV